MNNFHDAVAAGHVSKLTEVYHDLKAKVEAEHGAHLDRLAALTALEKTIQLLTPMATGSR